MVGTLEALALTQIVPERSTEILQRLDQYTHNRVVCGVHYPERHCRIAGDRVFALRTDFCVTRVSRENLHPQKKK